MKTIYGYSKKQISEAISNWRRQIKMLDEAAEGEEGEEDDNEERREDGASSNMQKKAEAAAERAAGNEIPDTDKAEGSADTIGTWSVGARFYRIHVAARKKAIAAVKAKVSKFMKLNDNAIKLVNSCVTSKGSFDIDDTMTVTLKVRVDESNVKGFRKFIAGALKESKGVDAKLVCEGWLGQLFKSAADGAKRLKDGTVDFAKDSSAAIKKSYAAGVKKANKELKDAIGVAGLQTYVKHLCGGDLASEVTEVKMGQENKGKVPYLTWTIKIDVES